MKIKIKLISIILFFIVFNSCFTFANDWLTYQYNNQHTGASENIEILFPLELRWQYQVSDGPLRQLSVGQDKVIATTYWQIYHDCYCGKIYCLNADYGDSLWAYSWGEHAEMSQATISDGTVFFQKKRTDSAAFIASYYIDTGQKIWHATYPSQGQIPLAATLQDSILIFPGGAYGGMFAIHPLTAETYWFQPLNITEWAPTIHNDRIYAFVNGYLGVFDLYTGELIHAVHLRDSIGVNIEKAPTNILGNAFSVPVIDTFKNIVYTNTLLEVTAYNYINQKVLWGRSQYNIKVIQSENNYPISFSPTFYKDELFVLDTNGCMTALDSETGKYLWEFCGDSNIVYSPVIGDGYLFLSSSFNLYAIDLSTRQEVWSYPVSGYLSLANDGLYVAGNDGVVSYFGSPSTGVYNEELLLPTKLILFQNYPNPFNPSTLINFEIPVADYVRITVYNTLGQKIKEITNRHFPGGRHSITWDGKDDQGNKVSSGVYVYKLTVGNKSISKKMILLK